jgi:hypothetical protein
MNRHRLCDNYCRLRLLREAPSKSPSFFHSHAGLVAVRELDAGIHKGGNDLRGSALPTSQDAVVCLKPCNRWVRDAGFCRQILLGP